MTLFSIKREQSTPMSLATTDNVIPALHHWQSEGKKVVLVTLIAIDGTSPRKICAQMAVSETGESYGHISGGCLKDEIIAKAQQVIKDKENRTIRYGKDSPYIDITLPCGSGLDLYFDQSITEETITEAFNKTASRTPFSLNTDLTTGITTGITTPDDPLTDNTFKRLYSPKFRLEIFGTDPATIALANLAIVSEIDVTIHTPDEDIHNEALTTGHQSNLLQYGQYDLSPRPDNWTAAVFFFHDHNWEIPLLKEILKTPAFYIGAQGSRRTHQSRIEALGAAGTIENELQRIKGPIGLIQQTKSPTDLAISTLAEIVSEKAKQEIWN